MDEALRTFVAESGTLRRVAGVRSGAGYAALNLVFDQGTLRLTSDADTDEIIVACSTDELPSSDSAPIGNDPVLGSLIGKTIE